MKFLSLTLIVLGLYLILKTQEEISQRFKSS